MVTMVISSQYRGAQYTMGLNMNVQHPDICYLEKQPLLCLWGYSHCSAASLAQSVHVNKLYLHTVEK